MLVDHSLPFDDRLALVRELGNQHRSLPMILIFEPGAHEDVVKAKLEGASECVIRDEHGEYLLRIPMLVEQYTERRSLNATHELYPDRDESEDEITLEVDLKALAEEIRGVTADKRRHSLVVLAGPNVGAVAGINGPMIIIGRDPSCHLRLSDDSISRFHARVKQDEDGIILINDLNSSNGTYIGGRRVAVARLKEGDKILLGKDTLIGYQLQDTIDKMYHEEAYSRI